MICRNSFFLLCTTRLFWWKYHMFCWSYHSPSFLSAVVLYDSRHQSFPTFGFQSDFLHFLSSKIGAKSPKTCPWNLQYYLKYTLLHFERVIFVWKNGSSKTIDLLKITALSHAMNRERRYLSFAVKLRSFGPAAPFRKNVFDSSGRVEARHCSGLRGEINGMYR